MENEINEISEKPKESVILFRAFFDAIQKFDNKDIRLECYEALINYGIYGITPVSTNPATMAVFIMAQPYMDTAKKRYDKCVENGKKGAEFGKKGGAPKGNQNARKNKTTPKQPLTDTVTDTVTETDIETVNETDNLTVNETEIETENNLNQLATNSLQNITIQNGVQVFNKTLSHIHTQFKNNFDLRSCDIKHIEKINSINLNEIDTNLLIDKIKQSNFLCSCPNLGLEWCILNYNKIIGDYYKNFNSGDLAPLKKALPERYNINFYDPEYTSL